MQNSTTLVEPLLGRPRLQLVTAWAAVICVSLLYWETCRLAHGAGSVNLHDSGLWMVEIWSGWLVLSFPAYECCRRWRTNPAGISVRQALGLMAGLSILSLCCEWQLNLFLSQHGGIERWESPWAMFNRRALLCVVASSAIVLFAVRPGFVLRKARAPAPPDADGNSTQPTGEASDRDDRTLVLVDRGQSIKVSLNDVEAILAAENYVEICVVSGKQYLHRATLAGIERELDPRRMLRVHRSAIVNVEKVSSRLPGWQLQLASGRTVRVGRSFREEVAERVNHSQHPGRGNWQPGAPPQQRS